jgi:hypothetical protein
MYQRYILIRTASLTKEVVRITIYNLYPDLELASPVYFSNGAACHVSPNQQIDTNNTMKASFGVGFKQKRFKGTLLYKLQRKRATEPGNHLDIDIASIKDIEESIYFLVCWSVSSYGHDFCVRLIECDNDFAWDEDKLVALNDRYWRELRKDYKSSIMTWLMNDGTLMQTRLNVTYGLDYDLNIVISEGTWKRKMLEPITVNSKW